MSEPVCSHCNDTHVMTLRDQAVPCTRCPTPCRACANGDGRGAFCFHTPCDCACHREPIKQLGDALKAAGARVTLDPHRSTAKPCVICGEAEKPRELVVVGTYTRRMGGNIQPGDKIERPLCKRCEELTA